MLVSVVLKRVLAALPATNNWTVIKSLVSIISGILNSRYIGSQMESYSLPEPSVSIRSHDDGLKACAKRAGS